MIGYGWSKVPGTWSVGGGCDVIFSAHRPRVECLRRWGLRLAACGDRFKVQGTDIRERESADRFEQSRAKGPAGQLRCVELITPWLRCQWWDLLDSMESGSSMEWVAFHCMGRAELVLGLALALTLAIEGHNFESCGWAIEVPSKFDRSE